MRIWLLQTWEPNPLDDPTDRPWRTGMLARELARRGHEVTWWASRFSHFKKRFRAESPGSYPLADRLEMRLLDALGYQRNVSLARLRDHRFVAEQFLKEAQLAGRPDVIVASYPTIEMAHCAARLSRQWGVPLLADIRDQYPDHYWEAAPAWLAPFIRIGCNGMRRAAHEALSQAWAITANGDAVVEFGLRYAGRARQAQDQTLFMTYERPEVAAADAEEADRFWSRLGIPMSHGMFVIAFAGTLGPTSSFDSLLQAADRFGEEVRVVICGDGSEFARLSAAFKNHANVVMPGRVSMPMLDALFKRSQAAYVPYLEVPNFQRAITNKMVESLAYGLPTISTLRTGVLADMLREYRAGLCLDGASPQELLKAVSTWVAEPESRAAFAEGAQRLFEDLLSPEAINKKWADLIESAPRSP